jgi:hypothetical protein
MTDSSDGADAGSSDSQLALDTADEQVSRSDVVDLLSAWRWPIFALLVLGGVLFVAGMSVGGYEIPTLPPVVRQFLKGVLLVVGPAYLLAKYTIVAWYVRDLRERVLVLDNRAGVGAVDLAIPSDLWESRRHEQERPAIEPSVGNIDYIVRSLDYLEDRDQIVVEGCNPELADPVSMSVVDHQIERIYQTLLPAQEELKSLQATMKARMSEAQALNLNAIAGAFYSETTVDAEPIRERIEQDDREQVTRAQSTGVDSLGLDASADVQDDRDAPDRAGAPTAEDVAREIGPEVADVLEDDRDDEPEPQPPVVADGGEDDE